MYLSNEDLNNMLLIYLSYKYVYNLQTDTVVYME